MDLIERVARAICSKTDVAEVGVTHAVFDDPDREYMGWVKGKGFVQPRKRWERYTEQAKAAIDAILGDGQSLNPDS